MKNCDVTDRVPQNICGNQHYCNWQNGWQVVIKARIVMKCVLNRISRWWFQISFIFTPTWGNDPNWLIFFRWVETTNGPLVFIAVNGLSSLFWRCFLIFFSPKELGFSLKRWKLYIRLAVRWKLATGSCQSLWEHWSRRTCCTGLRWREMCHWTAIVEYHVVGWHPIGNI